MQAGGRRFDPVRLHQVLGGWVLFVIMEKAVAPLLFALVGMGWVERLQEIGCAGVGSCKARGLLACLYGAVPVGMALSVCSLVIVNQVLVRFWARRTPRMALGPVCACRMLGSGGCGGVRGLAGMGV